MKTLVAILAVLMSLAPTPALARYYDPGTGTFLSPDPAPMSPAKLVEPIRMAPFLYANANPLRYTDPDGRWSVELEQRLNELTALCPNGRCSMPLTSEVMANIAVRDAQAAVQQAHAGSPEFSSAMSGYMRALHQQSDVASFKDFHANVAGPLARDLAVGAATLGAGAGSLAIARGLVVLGTAQGSYGLTQVATGDKIELTSEGFTTRKFRGGSGSWYESERVWTGIESTLTIGTSVAGGIGISAQTNQPLFSPATRGLGARFVDVMSGGEPTSIGFEPQVGGGSGPWVPGNVRQGGAVSQTLPGSCGAACVEMLSGGTKTQAQAVAEIGEWASPELIAGSLGSPWKAGFFGSGADAVAVAGEGPMGALLWPPGGRVGHMVVIEPAPTGFLVRDPEPGVNYSVGASWISRWVAGGVFKR